MINLDLADANVAAWKTICDKENDVMRISLAFTI